MPYAVPAQPALGAVAFVATITETIINDDFSEADRDRILHSAECSQKVRLHFRPDGIVVFDFSGNAAYCGGDIPAYTTDDCGSAPPHISRLHQKRKGLMYLRARYVNAFLACFNSAKKAVGQLTPPASLQNYIKVLGSGDFWSLQLAEGEHLYDKTPGAFITREEICEGVRLLSSARGSDIDETIALDIFSLLYTAAYNIEQHDYDSGLAVCWVITERCQNVLWNRFIEIGYKDINANTVVDTKRRELLTSRDFTAAIKSQILSFAGVYTDDVLVRLNTARKDRNALVHNLKRANVQQALEAMVVANEVLSLALKTDFRLFPAPGSKG
jgi:hypothetical protein